MVDILLWCSVFFNLWMLIYVGVKIKKNKYKKSFMHVFLILLIWCLTLLLQRLLIDSVNPFYIDCLSYISACFIPVAIYSISVIYGKGVLPKNIKYFCIVPLITILVIWTNDIHHWFYVKYSTDTNLTEIGWYSYIHFIYSYGLLVVSMYKLIKNSLRKSGFFSIQTGLIILGCLFPLVPNILGTIQIMPMSIYITPIMFIGTSVCFYLAIFKFKALNMTPVSYRTIVDTMSDAYIAISDYGTIIDKNKSFDKVFSHISEFKENDNFFDTVKEKNLIDIIKLRKEIKEVKKNRLILSKECYVEYNEVNKYFDVDIHPIKAVKGNEYVGTLLLFKDITQHKEDIATIEAKQEVIVKQGQLMSIGELAGGVAHDINTPISAIKTGLSMLEEREDKTEIEKELLDRMNNCADKIIKIVNSMRNQIRNLGSDEKVNFKLSGVINDIKTITYNEVKKKGCTLIIDIKHDLSVNGAPTKLGQVFTNLIINAVQAYDKKGGKIEVVVSKAPNNKVLVVVRDYAGGIPERIKKSVFKEILTTKGTKGTGLGLYLVYSVIKGEFGGDITLETVEGEGTTFYIVLDKAVENNKKQVIKENK